MRQIEAAVLARLGLARRSLAEAVHGQEQAERAEFYRSRGRGVRGRELWHDPAEVGPMRRRPEAWELAHERAVAEFLSRN